MRASEWLMEQDQKKHDSPNAKLLRKENRFGNLMTGGSPHNLRQEAFLVLCSIYWKQADLSTQRTQGSWGAAWVACMHPVEADAGQARQPVRCSSSNRIVKPEDKPDSCCTTVPKNT